MVHSELQALSVSATSRKSKPPKVKKNTIAIKTKSLSENHGSCREFARIQNNHSRPDILKPFFPDLLSSSKLLTSFPKVPKIEHGRQNKKPKSVKMYRSVRSVRNLPGLLRYLFENLIMVRKNSKIESEFWCKILPRGMEEVTEVY